MKGSYIVFEGIVGTGKSTQSRKLYDYLKKKLSDREIVLTHEPGGDEIADSIRKIVQATNFKQGMTHECEAYLYAASRAQTLRTVIKPVLNRGGIVISDRSYISSAAYQGAARDLGIDKILEINKEAIGNIIPDLIIFIDLEPRIGLRRSFDAQGDKFEKETIEFFKRVELGYKEIAQREEFRNRWVNISGEGDIETVHGRIIQRIKTFLHIF
jgi:dTMP kinase